MGPEELKELTENYEKLKRYLDQVTKGTRSFGSSLVTSAQAAKTSTKELKGLEEQVDKTKKEMARFDLDKFIGGIKGFASEARDLLAKAGTSLVNTMSQNMKALGKVTDDGSSNIARMINSGIPLAMAQLQVDLTRQEYKIPFFEEIENGLKTAQRQIMQMTIPFATLRDQTADVGEGGGKIGGVFLAAQQNVSGFNTFLAQSIQTTRNSQEAIIGVAQALGKTFGPRATDAVKGLDIQTNKLGVQMTQVDAALLISSATGANHSEIVRLMEEAYLDLGSELGDTISMFGGLFDAATKSGIGFERTARSIMESTKMLKFWGGTIDSITPLFNTFSQSLRGIGRQGLTPELLRTFVSGLDRMNFSTRALLSMQMPGARGAGLLGGGLRMEAALEKGPEGMREVVSSLTATLKRFGGPQILTREQAIESPALTRNYMIQRQLLGQMMNISDPAQQNRMMQILQDIDKGGIAASADNMTAVRELLQAGEQVADETVTAIDRATQILKSAIQVEGQNMREAIKGIGIETGFGDIIQDIQSMVAKAARGEMTPTQILGGVKEILTRRPEGAGPVSRAEQRQQSALTNALSKAMTVAVSQQATGPGLEQAIKGIVGLTTGAEEREQFVKAGEIPADVINAAMATVQRNIETQMKEIKGRAGLAPAERKTELRFLQTTFKQLDNELNKVKETFAKMTMEERGRIITASPEQKEEPRIPTPPVRPELEEPKIQKPPVVPAREDKTTNSSCSSSTRRTKTTNSSCSSSTRRTKTTNSSCSSRGKRVGRTTCFTYG
jgi:hypothetical protein